MIFDIELVALVALLYHNSSRGSYMALRQRLIEGELPHDILESDNQSDVLYERALADVEQWIRAGQRPLSWCDEDYPQQLREVHDFPPVIFVRGHLVAPDNGICIVGSRHASRGAIDATRDIARLVVEEGWTVVSGLAQGIDTAAHTEALSRNGRTVAIIGNGIDHYYPAQNRNLQCEIEEYGLVLSQFWPGMRPTKFSFPMRNAVMSAYGQATIIVSAQEKSGTRHQAKQAVAHGRPLVVSKQVYESTTWARRLVDDPAVLGAVAYSAEQAVNLAIKMAQLSIEDLRLLPWHDRT
ncbi:DNA-processing protein DprA [Enterococcus sp. AN402]|uniref:DNA-processing protein DprA n=1 Tax=Enterococcus sp. AN402 TaxID=3151386 RepID=UPI003458A503